MLRPFNETRGNVLLISPGGHADNQIVASLMHLTGRGVTHVAHSRNLPMPKNPDNFGLDGAITWKNEMAPDCTEWPSGVKPVIIASAGLVDPHTVTDNSGEERALFTSYDARGLARVSHIPYIELGLNPAGIFGAMLRETLSHTTRQVLPFIPGEGYVVPRYADKAIIERRVAAALRSGTVALQRV